MLSAQVLPNKVIAHVDVLCARVLSRDLCYRDAGLVVFKDAACSQALVGALSAIALHAPWQWPVLSDVRAHELRPRIWGTSEQLVYELFVVHCLVLSAELVTDHLVPVDVPSHPVSTMVLQCDELLSQSHEVAPVLGLIRRLQVLKDLVRELLRPDTDDRCVVQCVQQERATFALSLPEVIAVSQSAIRRLIIPSHDAPQVPSLHL